MFTNTEEHQHLSNLAGLINKYLKIEDKHKLDINLYIMTQKDPVYKLVLYL